MEVQSLMNKRPMFAKIGRKDFNEFEESDKDETAPESSGEPLTQSAKKRSSILVPYKDLAFKVGLTHSKRQKMLLKRV